MSPSVTGRFARGLVPADLGETRGSLRKSHSAVGLHHWLRLHTKSSSRTRLFLIGVGQRTAGVIEAELLGPCQFVSSGVHQLPVLLSLSILSPSMVRSPGLHSCPSPSPSASSFDVHPRSSMSCPNGSRRRPPAERSLARAQLNRPIPGELGARKRDRGARALALAARPSGIATVCERLRRAAGDAEHGVSAAVLYSTECRR